MEKKCDRYAYFPFGRSGKQICTFDLFKFDFDNTAFSRGLIAFAFGLITFQKIVLYCVLGLFYSLFYGFITIPTSYRYGTANSKYFFMLFIFIPIFWLPALYRFIFA